MRSQKPSLRNQLFHQNQELSRQVAQPSTLMPLPGISSDNPILNLERTVKDSRIRKTIEHLRTTLHLAHSLESIARQVNLSASRLRSLFRKVTGLSLAHFVKLLRLETARQLLMTEYLTVKEVMAKTGIKDPSHFNRNFKLAYGVTPSQYRSQLMHFGCQAFSGL